MLPNRSIVTGGRAEDWITETCSPVPRHEADLWPDRQHAAQVALADVEADHIGLQLLQAARASGESLASVGAPEVITLAALLQAAVGRAALDGDEATAWAVIAADVLS